MADMEFNYKGKKILIHDKHPHATVSVDGREFSCHHHHPQEGRGLPMWMCDEAYFASPDVKELARHFADYGYMFDDPGRVLVNDAGEVVAVTTKKPPVKTPPTEPDKKSGAGGHAGHGGGGR